MYLNLFRTSVVTNKQCVDIRIFECQFLPMRIKKGSKLQACCLDLVVVQLIPSEERVKVNRF